MSVSGYDVTEIRKILETIRKGWNARDTKHFSYFQSVSKDDTVWSFSVKYVVSQYRRRKARREKKSQQMVTRSRARKRNH